MVKYLVVASGAVAGVLICVRSYAAYFAAGWLPVIVVPLAVVSGAANSLLKSQPQHEQVFVYVWLFIALLEIFLLWVPLVSALLRRPVNMATQSAASDERGHSNPERRE